MILQEDEQEKEKEEEYIYIQRVENKISNTYNVANSRREPKAPSRKLQVKFASITMLRDDSARITEVLMHRSVRQRC